MGAIEKQPNKTLATGAQKTRTVETRRLYLLQKV